MSYLQLFRSLRPKTTYFGYLLLPLLLTVGLRSSGMSSQWELLIFDRLLSILPTEAVDDRIAIVTIDEEDLKNEPNRSSISDRKLAQVINLIAAAKPKVIGIDIIRDGKIDPQLVAAYQNHQNAIGLAKILPPDRLAPPQGLTLDRVGFGDYQPDPDSAVRRATLAVFKKDRIDRSILSDPQYSFAFQIAHLYLQQNQKIEITPDRLELGSHSISPLTTVDNSDRSQYFDILIKYRHTYPTFLTIKLADLLAKKHLNLEHKIVLIGYTATTKQDFINTHVVHNPEINGNIYGVEYHAQIISQLVATTLNERNSIQPVPWWGEYLWMLISTIGMGLAIAKIRFNTTFWQILAIASFYFIGILLSIYLLFLAGWWLSIGFTFSMILIIYVPIISSFCQREQSLIAISQKRYQAISETFNAIHNGPLQELSLLLQAIKSDRITLPEINHSLGRLNRQIRSIGEALQTDIDQKEVVDPEILVLGDGDRIDLNIPLNEIFYLVADRTIDRDRYPHLSNLKIKIINFQEVPSGHDLDVDLKRQLCQFLEEAIGNVGKYAQGATKLQLIGKVDRDLYRLSIEDNGREQLSNRVGEGTKQAQRLAVSLKGKFNRSANLAGDGVICSIEWNFKRKF
jgi:CHASE2 domain-containing sensor protein